MGNGEPFYAETVQYIESLKKCGTPAGVDVYHSDMHAFDMMQPDRWNRYLYMLCCAAWGMTNATRIGKPLTGENIRAGSRNHCQRILNAPVQDTIWMK